MQPGKYEYQSDFARRYFGEGRQEGRHEGRVDEAGAILLALASRHGTVADELRGRVIACLDPAQLRALAVEIAGAPDLAAVERLIARLPPAPARAD